MTDLEQKLLSLGRELHVPECPDLVPGVLDRIRPPRHVPRRRLVLALAVVLVAALVATLAIPEARSALQRILMIGGDRIELVDELPAVAANPPELDLALALGERSTLADARRRAGFDLLELEQPPDDVFLGGRDTVWFLYGTSAAVRLLVAQTPALDLDEPFLLKKLVPSGTRVERVEVRGVPAYFVSGEPHVILLLDERGEAVQETARLARDVLVWEEEGHTVRLEGDFTIGEAVEIADSLR
ncbi:MAG TPA: hypothetical protein VMN35_07350 [Gaiellaceae bacterium]|nr:hypothetical protein [Gaiellaceae bacterium]